MMNKTSRLIRRFHWATAVAVLVILLSAMIVLWQPIVHGHIFLPLDLLAHMPPWRYSYERTGITNPIPSDLVLEYYPRRLLATQMLRQGQLPLWNPTILSGTPLLADGYSSLFYPLSMLFVVLPVAQAFGWYALVHLVIAGLGTYWFIRGLASSRSGALLASLTYIGCGFTMTWLAFPDFSPVIAWLPVTLGCVERYEQIALERSRNAVWLRLSYGTGAAVSLAFCVLCQLQLGAIVGMSLGVYWLTRRLIHAPRTLLEVIVALVGVGGMAILLSAVQWVPSLELAFQSQRRGAVNDIVQHFGIEGLLRLISPMVFGQQRTNPSWGPPKLDAHFPYVGMLPLLLALWGAWHTRTPGRLALVILGLVSLGATMLPAALVRDIPLLNQLPASYRWLMVTSLALAGLAANGYDNLCVQRRLLRQTKLGAVYNNQVAIGRSMAVTTLVTLAVMSLEHLQLFTPMSRYGHYYTLLAQSASFVSLILSLSALSLVVAFVAWNWTSTCVLTINNRIQMGGTYLLRSGALLLVIIDLGWYGLPLQSSADPHQLFQPTRDLLAAIGEDIYKVGLTSDLVYPPTRSSEFLQKHLGLYRVLGADYPSLQPNSLSVFGVQDVRGYASLFSQRYLDFVRRWEGKPTGSAGWAQVYLNQAYTTRPLLDLLGVRYIFFNPQSRTEEQYTGLELIRRDDEGSIYQNPTVLPRVFLVHHAEVVPDEPTVLSRLTSTGFPISTTIVLTEPPPVLQPAIPGQPEAAVIERYTALEVDVQVTASAPGMLVLTDTYYPGWEASLDGQQAHVYRVDSILRGVAVPAGRHTIQFRYRPMSFHIGAAISITGMLLLCWNAAKILRQARS